jgi:hypothetical protein
MKGGGYKMLTKNQIIEKWNLIYSEWEDESCNGETQEFYLSNMSPETFIARHNIELGSKRIKKLCEEILISI